MREAGAVSGGEGVLRLGPPSTLSQPSNCQQLSPAITFRVVGVRQDKNRVVLGDGMQLQHAQWVTELLAAGITFTSVEVQPDSAPESDS
jgi:hypothetical protein